MGLKHATTKCIMRYVETFDDCLSFDITYKLCNNYTIVEEKGKKKEAYWNVGIFIVFIEDCRPIIAAICFVLH